MLSRFSKSRLLEYQTFLRLKWQEIFHFKDKSRNLQSQLFLLLTYGRYFTTSFCPKSPFSVNTYSISKITKKFYWCMGVFRDLIFTINRFILRVITQLPVGRDSSVDIATRYGLDGPGFESRWRRVFPHLSRPALGSTQPPIKCVPGQSRGVKRQGRGVDHPPQLAPRLKKE
jgi:hypothetical protein